ncbi:nicotinate-nucleotide--dimethylbenzimidazole phosphoribosyltransferase [Bradyrhizobium sp. 200]|nr:nicotinate-nucleotide--dimethylbenzimidazole phosphoribosyltransferase [Bradyrhizobium sp. 200]
MRDPRVSTSSPAGSQALHRQGLPLQAAPDVQPLFNLDLRLGEGSGAALALPILRLACALNNGMTTFAQAKVPNRS